MLAADPRVDLDTTDKEGRGLEENIWCVFCKRGDLEEVKDALQRGVDVNTKGTKGRTGLMQAQSCKMSNFLHRYKLKPKI